MKKSEKKKSSKIKNILALLGIIFIIKAILHKDQVVVINGMKVETGNVESVDELVDGVVEEVEKKIEK